MPKTNPLQSSLFDLPGEAAQQPPAPPAIPPPAIAGPPDHNARQQALDVRRSFIVEAPAGSGKTGLLVQRFLKLLGDESVTRPEQVLAITFTVKATAEMRDRILRHLEAATREPAPHLSDFDRQTRTLALAVLERDRQLSWALLDQPNRLHIRTIDSVCAEIARTLPILSGSGGHLSATQDARPLHREAARRTLLLLGTPDSDPVLDASIRDLLLHRDGNLDDCENLIADMLEQRDQWGSLIPLTAPHLDDAWLDANVLPRLEQALAQTICATLTRVEANFPPDILAELADIAGHLGHAAPYKSAAPSPIFPCSGIHASPGGDAAHLERWTGLVTLLMTKGGELRKERGLTAANLKFEYNRKHPNHHRLVRVLDALHGYPDLLPLFESVTKLPSAQYPADQWAVAKSLFRILSRALIQLQLVFAERGQCDFTEVTLLARTALIADSGPEDLAAALGARLQHLLVDEMQDTSAGQYELLRLLTASWDGHSQTVFLVGDPRQSIYLFRQARVESFLQTLDTCQLGELPLTRLRLTANFRSQQLLVEHFNRDFDLVFPAESAPGSLPYSPADSVLPPSAFAAGLIWQRNPVEIRPAPPLPPESLRSPAQLRQHQARRDAYTMRRIIERWSRTPLPEGRTQPWRIAVLVRSRSHLIEVTAEFDKQRPHPIPYRAVDIVPLADRQEVLDLIALTRTLLHPADRVAGLAVLRAPWCGLSLADLHTLTGAGDPALQKLSIRRLMRERGDLLPEASINRLERVWHVLDSAAAQDGRHSTASLVERAWRSLGGDAWLTEPELSNARRFFRLLDEMETEAGSASAAFEPGRLAERMRLLYAEPAPALPGTPTVDLLTIHGAKGLEWDVVLVPALERKGAANRPRLLTWSELEDASSSSDSGPSPILLAPIAAKGEEVDDLTTWIKDIHKRRDAAERKRLFYVASTRAREELHLFAAPDLTNSGTLNPGQESLLRAAWAAADSHFAELKLARTGIRAVPPQQPSTPQPSEESAESIILDIAASAPLLLRPPIQRLPLDFDPRAELAAHSPRLPYGQPGQETPADALFARPEGSFAARSFGNVVHAMLDLLAHRILEGETPAQLLAELPTWVPRITAILRADGLPNATVAQLTRDTRTALELTLRDPTGLWLLASHPAAASEFSLTSWSAPNAPSGPASVRVDRVFHAGPDPHAPGESCLWIIDYKTTAPGSSSLDDFLAKHRTTYGPQLETYARILAPARAKSLDEVRLALYFPTIPRLHWWTPTPPPTDNWT